MPGRRKTRPWGSLRGATPQQNAAAALLRSWMDEAGLTLNELHGALTREHFSGGPLPSRSTVGERLAGCNLTETFIEAVAAVCFPDEATREARAEQGKKELSAVPSAGRGPAPARQHVSPLVLARLHGKIEDLKREPTVNDEPPGQAVERLHQENEQLRLNVAELGSRVARLMEELDTATRERDRLRRRCEAISRKMASREGLVRKQTEKDERVGGPQSNGQFLRPSLGAPEGDPDPPSARLVGGPGPQPGLRTPNPEASPRSCGSADHSADAAAAHGGTTLVREAPLRETPAGKAAEATVEFPLEFRAFHMMNHESYLRYASLHLQSRELAEEVVDEVFCYLLADWESLLRQQHLAASAWRFLRHTVQQRHTQVQGPEPAFVQAMAKARTSLALIDSELGLYAAITRLPERMFDAVVLRYVLGYDSNEAACVLGVSRSTLRALLSVARRRLARDLNMGYRS
ncbi:sigma-70 family RNA polymerase sigma factor [Streptomyces hygroscopicus]|uniref:RNA polymerase sigma factor n=1 Tax=Streptomyces hygroscopicus TaxID=1912 RepID=UPI00340112B3